MPLRGSFLALTMVGRFFKLILTHFHKTDMVRHQLSFVLAVGNQQRGLASSA